MVVRALVLVLLKICSVNAFGLSPLLLSPSSSLRIPSSLGQRSDVQQQRRIPLRRFRSRSAHAPAVPCATDRARGVSSDLRMQIDPAHIDLAAAAVASDQAIKYFVYVYLRPLLHHQPCPFNLSLLCLGCTVSCCWCHACYARIRHCVDVCKLPTEVSRSVRISVLRCSVLLC